MTQHTSIGSAHHEGPTGWWRSYRRHHYAVLFYSLILTVVAEPIVKAIGMTGNFLQLFVGLNLLAAAVPVESRKGRWVLPAILLAAVLIRIWSLLADHVGLSATSLVLWAGIAMFAVFSAMRFVLRSSAITSEHLYAALSTYLLVGVFLGMVYWSSQQVWPDSIIVSGAGASPRFRR